MDDLIIILILCLVFLFVVLVSLLCLDHINRTKISYFKKINKLLKRFNLLRSSTLGLDIYIDFLTVLKDYVYLINLYKLENPTKTGKVILISLNKLLSLLTEYNKSILVVKETDIIKPSDFKKIIEDSLKETIDVIEKDISIIKQKKLIQIVDIIKDINK